jgi:hypothetical protein
VNLGPKKYLTYLDYWDNNMIINISMRLTAQIIDRRGQNQLKKEPLHRYTGNTR